LVAVGFLRAIVHAEHLGLVGQKADRGVEARGGA
jgi:hypothetical protein